MCNATGSTFDRECALRYEHEFWEKNCFSFQGYSDDRSACGIFHIVVHAELTCFRWDCPDDDKFQNWLSLRSAFLRNMANHSRIRPFSQIRDTIREELLEPRTAFVSRAETFDSD